MRTNSHLPVAPSRSFVKRNPETDSFRVPFCEVTNSSIFSSIGHKRSLRLLWFMLLLLYSYKSGKAVIQASCYMRLFLWGSKLPLQVTELFDWPSNGARFSHGLHCRPFVDTRSFMILIYSSHRSLFSYLFALSCPLILCNAICTISKLFLRSWFAN